MNAVATWIISKREKQGHPPDPPSLTPYTMGSLKAVLRLGDKTQLGKVHLNETPGVVPGLYELIPGCKFSTHSPSLLDVCREKELELKEIEKNHVNSYWLNNWGL